MNVLSKEELDKLQAASEYLIQAVSDPATREYYRLALRAANETIQRREAAEKPIIVTDDMALSFHHALTDGAIGSDDLHDIKVGLSAALHGLTQHITPPKKNRDVILAITRPEGYEDVDPDLVAEDAIKPGWEWRTLAAEVKPELDRN